MTVTLDKNKFKFFKNLHVNFLLKKLYFSYYFVINH